MRDKIAIEIQEIQAKIEKENELTCLLMSLSESKDDKDNDVYFRNKK